MSRIRAARVLFALILLISSLAGRAATQRELFDEQESHVIPAAPGVQRIDAVNAPEAGAFQLVLETPPEAMSRAFLVYELSGAPHWTAAVRSINGLPASGGFAALQSSGTALQIEEIHPRWLRAGVNQILFLPARAGDARRSRLIHVHRPERIVETDPDSAIAYTVRNLRLVYIDGPMPTAPSLRLSHPLNGENDAAGTLLRGFVDPAALPSGPAELFVNEVYLPHAIDQADGSFSVFAPRTAPEGEPWEARIEIVYPDGSRLRHTVHLAGQTRSDDDGDRADEAELDVDGGSDDSLGLGKARLDITPGSLGKKVKLSMRALRRDQLPALDAGMTNVTPRAAGFRLGPHGLRFRKPVHLRLPYDPALIPRGMTVQDVRTFYFDEQAGRWFPLPRVDTAASVDIDAKGDDVIVSATDHFTDFINATLTVPDDPSGANFGPGAMAELAKPDPAAEVVQIEPPEGGPTGDATLHYPLVVPPGRRGMQPDLAVHYNSSAANGWLGVGWDLRLPAIEISTLFGVPQYKGTERYLLDGEQLAPASTPGEFVRRTEGKFDRIVRKGSSPADYWWEVTDKNGTRFLYGRTTQARLRDPKSGSTFRWHLEQEIDLHGNTIDYAYVTDAGGGGAAGEAWTETYPKRIDYTGVRGEGAYYHVVFTLDEGDRPDRLSSGRPGFKTYTRRLLARVDVLAGEEIVRSYVFRYAEGDFQKSVLESIAVTGEGGATEFHRHRFEYFRMAPAPGGGYAAFSAPQAWSGMGSSDFTDSFRTGGGAHGFAGLGDPSCRAHVGLQLGGSGTDTKQRVSFLDVNGDGLPDRLSEDGRVAVNRYDPKADPQGSLPGRFESTQFNNTTLLGHTSEWSLDFGLGAHYEAGITASVGASWVWSHANDDRLITDMNGDLRPDLVTTAGGFSVRLNDGSSFVSSGNWSGFTATGLKLSSDEESSDVRTKFRLADALRQLVLPYDGRITLTGAIQKKDAKGDGVSVEIYHNGARVWSRRFEANDLAACAPGPGSSCDGGLDREVRAGDSLYFLSDSISDTDGDALLWSPVVAYHGRDANAREPHGPRTFVFDGREDFQLAGFRGPGWGAVAGGTVRISGPLVKRETSDDVTVSVVRSRDEAEQVVFTRTFAAAEQATLDGIAGDIAVQARDLLFLRITSHMPIDPARVQWSPTVSYVGTTDPELPEKARAQVAQVALLIPELVQEQPTRSWMPPSTDAQTFSVVCAVDPLSPPAATFYVQGVNRLLARHAAAAAFTVTVPVTANEPLFFTTLSEITISAPVIGELAVPPPLCIVNGNAAIPVNRRWKPASPSQNVLSGGHHGWFFGEWNGNADFTPSALVPPKNKDEDPDFVPATPHWEGTPPREDGTRAVSAPAWTASGFDLYHAAEGAKASRKGLNATAVLDQAAGIAPGGGLSVLRKTSGKTSGIEASAGVGLAVSGGTSNTDLDLIDMNGDRYPDQVSGSGVRFSDGVDEFEPLVGFSNLGPRVRQSEDSNISTSVGLGITFTKKNGKGKTSAVLNTLPSVGVGVSLSQSKYDLVDVNGDGLPDRVEMSPGGDAVSVRLNLGYRFGEAETWKLPKLSDANRCNDIADVSGKLAQVTGLDTLNGLSFTRSSVKQVGVAIGPFGGGASTTLARTLVELIDVNGDGLPDRVAKDDDGAFQVQLNLGDHWDEPKPWHAPDWPGSSGLADGYNPLGVFQCLDAVSFSGHVEVQGSVGAPICIPLVPPIPVVGLQIEISAQGFGSTRSGMQLFLDDLDGDGLADHVFKSNGDVWVKRNKAGRVNLLKTVHRPLGSTLEIDYQRRGNHADMPFSQWVISRVTVGDGRGSSLVTEYRYDNDAVYDRKERESYGYGHVRVVLPDQSTIDREYLNDNFYQRHLQKKETLRAADKSIFHVAKAQYELRGVAGDSYFPALVGETSEFYEGTSTVEGNAPKSTGRTYAYDSAGNVIATTESGDSGSDDDVTATIAYELDAQRRLTRPTTVTVQDGRGNLLRKRQGTYNSAGDLTRLEQTLAGGRDPESGFPYSGSNNAISTFTYDEVGNLTSSTDPSRYTETFTYDTATRTHPVEVRDSFSYVTLYAYDLKYGHLTDTTDQNGSVIRRVYDGFGRVARIIGPYDSDSAPTLWFDYGATGVIAWAVAHHKDATRSDPIDSSVFIDSLGRVLQTKEDAELDGGSGTSTRTGMRVSGRVTFDAKGRVASQGQPVFDEKARADQFVTVADKNPTTFTFDALDRVVSVRFPHNATTSIAYGFGSLDNAQRFLTTRTDPAGRKTKFYRDVQDNVVAIEQTNAGKTLITRYAYDPLDQLIAVTDAKKNVTRLEYDTLGRNVTLHNPDLGRTEMRYDPAGNLKARITANLAAAGQQIRYLYTFRRLDRIDYPQSADVVYTYGAPKAPFNRANRIVTVADESGVEERSYGELGEVVQTVKTTSALNGNTPKGPYTTRFQFDSFDRLLSVVYPDGETLTYGYDAGGNVKSAAGLLGGARFEYLRHLGYDEFGAHARVILGNGVETRYAYEPLSRFLSQLRTTAGGRDLQNLRYQYDRTGTMQALQNDVPASSPSLYGGPVSQTFQYDELVQLIGAQGTYRSGSNKTSTYNLTLAYDELGNTLTKNQIHQAGNGDKLNVEKKTTYNATYGYNAPQPHAPTGIGERTFSYDLHGNQTGWTSDANGTRRTLSWNEENRLSAVADNGQTTRFLYDHDGMRTNKAGPHGETTYVNRWFTLRNGAIASKHVFAGDVRIATKVSPDPAPPSEKVYFFQTDHLGSSHFITDERATVFQHLEYFPSGEIWVDERSETQRTPYLFSGKELDEETGLSYFGHRYYDARQGQWISADPILDEMLEKLDSADLSDDAFHLPGAMTGYVANDPLNHTDEHGLAKGKAKAKAKAHAAVGKPMKKRLAFVGGTPGKNSGTGIKVRLRMKTDKLLRKVKSAEEVKVFVATLNKYVWRPVDSDIHMGHIVDAVRLWNGIGRYFGPKHKVVRDIMKDPDNYILEHGPTNMSKGGSLGATTQYATPNSALFDQVNGKAGFASWRKTFHQARKQYLTPKEWNQLKKHVPAQAH